MEELLKTKVISPVKMKAYENFYFHNTCVFVVQGLGPKWDIRPNQ
jgi:hypothetical protein